jgi:hypothetical protein
VEIVEAVDGEGRRLRPAPGVPNAQWQAWAARGLPVPPQVQAEHWVTFPDVDTAIASLKTLKARATFRFPLDVRTVEFESPKQNDTKELGDLVFRVTAVDRTYVMLTLQCKGDSTLEAVQELLDFQSFEMVDKNGQAGRADAAPSGLIDQRTFQFYVMNRQGPVHKFRFKLRDIAPIRMDFEFSGLEVPR